MLLVLQIALLIGMIKLLIETEKPLLCAGIYAGVAVVISLAVGTPFLAVMLGGAITFGFVFGWFWLLLRVGEGPVWWCVLIAGLVLPCC
jgi:hypothetical protein